MSQFRFAIHLGLARSSNEDVRGWKRIIGPLWISIQWNP